MHVMWNRASKFPREEEQRARRPVLGREIFVALLSRSCMSRGVIVEDAGLLRER